VEAVGEEEVMGEIVEVAIAVDLIVEVHKVTKMFQLVSNNVAQVRIQIVCKNVEFLEHKLQEQLD
jgi:hypothetical protein